MSGLIVKMTGRLADLETITLSAEEDPGWTMEVIEDTCRIMQAALVELRRTAPARRMERDDVDPVVRLLARKYDLSERVAMDCDENPEHVEVMVAAMGAMQEGADELRRLRIEQAELAQAVRSSVEAVEAAVEGRAVAEPVERAIAGLRKELLS